MLPGSTHCLGEGSQLAATKGCGCRADICAHDEKRKQLYGIHWQRRRRQPRTLPSPVCSARPDGYVTPDKIPCNRTFRVVQGHLTPEILPSKWIT